MGVEYLPGESNIMQVFSQESIATPSETSSIVSATIGRSKFTTTISVIENQRRWLGLGWTPSLLPHERAPFTDVEDHPAVPPENTALPEPKTTIEAGGVTRSVTWKWIDHGWRVEKDRGRDPEGWLYFDNAWRHPSATEEFGRYTRRRKWIRNAECTEVVTPSSQASSRTASVSGNQKDPDPDRGQKGARPRTMTIDPEKVRSSVVSPVPSKVPDKVEEKKETETPVEGAPTPKAEWREVKNGGRELITNDNTTLKKRPFMLRRRSSRASNRSVGVD